MDRSPPLPHHPQRRRQRGTAGAQYAGLSGLININKDDALLHYLTGHYPVRWYCWADCKRLNRIVSAGLTCVHCSAGCSSGAGIMAKKLGRVDISL